MPADPEADAAAGGGAGAPTAAGDVVAHLRELGLATALIGTPEKAAPISAVATDADAGPGDLAWSKRGGSAARFAGSLLICSPEAAGELRSPAAPGTVIVVCERPRLAMAQTVSRFFMHLTRDRPPVYADPETERQVEHGRAWVMNVTVGRNVRIEPLATIGCSGMGYERDGEGRLIPFPQLGGVVLEDDVHIAAQAMVQRAAIGDTIVRRGAKVGPHVNVGHNVDVGADCLITGHAQIGGGARLGRGTVVWQSAAIANGVTVGEGAVIGMGAMIRRDVGDGEVWVGNPGRRLR